MPFFFVQDMFCCCIDIFLLDFVSKKKEMFCNM